MTSTVVSIVIPAFNDQAGINTCLEGISRQTYPHDLIEVIVVDNGSTPALIIHDAFGLTIRLERCPKPGSYAARNVGTAAATGTVLAFTDADCRPDPHWLENGLTALDAKPGCAVIGGEVLLEWPARPSAVALYQCITGFGQEENIRDKGFSATANLFCTRSQFETVGPFDERLLSGGDREWCWRASRHGISVLYEPKALIHTQPRTHLSGAIRQARRVVAGRKSLRQLRLTHIGDAGVAKQRSSWQAIISILSTDQLRLWDRFRVLFVAILIRAAAAFESLRLGFGRVAERR